MKKNLLKICCTIICVLMACTTLFACGGSSDNNGGDGKGKLQLVIQNAGYGTTWLEEAMKVYTKETGVQFEKLKKYNDYGQTSKSAMNYTNNNADLFFDIEENQTFYTNLAKGKTYTDGNSDFLYADISDVYNSTITGYGSSYQTIKDLVPDFDYRNYTWTDGKQYAFSWARGVEGLIYNKGLFTANNLSVPRTTDELLALCAQIKTKNLINPTTGKTIYAFNWSDGYWGQCSFCWTFQYEGLDAYNNYIEGKDTTGKYSANIFKLDGKYKAYEKISDIIKYANGYSNPACSGYSFTQAQIKFLEGDSFIMPNGDWVEREMKANFEGEAIDIEFMKMPVNSAIIDKLSTVNDDATLVKVIDYIDGVSTEKPASVSDADIDYVRNARNMVYTQQLTHFAYIPFYSDMISEAKEFIKFLYRKDIQMLMCKKSYGGMFSTKYDFSSETDYGSFSGLKKSADKIYNDNSIFLGRESSKPMYYLGACPHAFGGQTDMALQNEFKTATETVNGLYNLYKNNFGTYMTQAGVSNS